MNVDYRAVVSGTLLEYTIIPYSDGRCVCTTARLLEGWILQSCSCSVYSKRSMKLVVSVNLFRARI